MYMYSIHVLCYCNLLFNLCLFFLLYFVTDLPFLLFFPLAMTRPNASAESNTSLFLPKITNDVSSPSDDEVEAEGDDSHSNANRDRVELAVDGSFGLVLPFADLRVAYVGIHFGTSPRFARSLPAHRLNISSVELPEPK